MVRKVDVEYLLNEKERICIIDVRTPSEYRLGHIPGALNLPLFSDEERSEVGTLYKQEGPEMAMQRGLEIVGPRMHVIPGSAHELAEGREILLHCWRGGKRSASIAWLLSFTGTPVQLLEGGYKAFRRYVHRHFEQSDHRFIVLGGKTGSGKTEILHALREIGEQVVDFEGLACHKGSAFGWIGEAPQPSTEHFENLIFTQLLRLDHNRPVWVENESRSIGRVFIPQSLWKRMKGSPLVQMQVPDEERVERLVSMYVAKGHLEELREAFLRISKRLGGQNVKEAISALEEGDFSHAARVALRYYDKTYAYNLANNKAPIIRSVRKKAGASIEYFAKQLAAQAEEVLSTTV